MKNIGRFFAFAVLAVVVSGCTQGQRARSMGGTMTIKLVCDTKLVNATWKQDNLWYLVRPMRQDEKPEMSIFQEDSSFGVWEGKVTFMESNCR